MMVASINGSNSADLMNLGKSNARNVTVDMQDGNDLLNWSGSTSFTLVDGGSGIDTLTLTEAISVDFSKGYGTVFTNFEVLMGSSLNDFVKASTQFLTVDLAAGNDTFIWTGDTNFTSITGGIGSDTLAMANGATLDLTSGYGTKFSNFEILTGSSSNDYITVTTQYTSINLGLGNDRFSWNGINSFTGVDGGNGTDTLLLSDSTTVDFTKNFGTAFRNFEVLIGSSLADTVINTTQFATINLDAGNDVFIWGGQTKFKSVDGGSDTDTLSFTTGSTLDLTKGYGTFFKNFEILNGSSLTDNVNTGSSFSIVDLGGGNDTFTWTGDTKFTTISGGSGIDTLVMAKGATLDLNSGYGTKFSNFESLIGSSTNDYITVTTQYTSVNLGLGNDQLSWNGINSFTAVDGSNGTDTLVLSDATTVDFVSGTGKVFRNFEVLTGSSLADTVTVSTQFSSIDLGSGDDTLIWTGVTKFTSINGGAGTDTLIIGNGIAVSSGKTTPITINSTNGFNGFEKVIGSNYADTITVTTGNVTVDGGAGNDILKGGYGDTTLIGGAGNDTLVGGSGKETYIFGTGFGQDTILDMTGNSNDAIQFGIGISKKDLLISKSGNNLVLKTAAADSLTLQNWYTAGTNKINNFTFADGSTDTINNFVWGSDINTTPGTFDIRFDYSFDTAGFFDATKRQVLEEAASAWESIIHEDFPIVAKGQMLSITNPATGVATTVTTDDSYATTDLTIFVGAHELGTNILGRAGPCGWYSNDQRYVGSVFQPIAGSLQIDINSEFYYDTTPTTTNDIPYNKVDFLSVAEHEIGHILGLGLAPQWKNLISGTNFIGSNTQNAYGGAVPLNTGLDHFGTNVTIGGIHPLMDPSTGSGIREPITALDIAALKDLGYNV